MNDPEKKQVVFGYLDSLARLQLISAKTLWWMCSLFGLTLQQANEIYNAWKASKGNGSNQH
jgi:hypothetical protein